jgi:hypothetical protein
MVWYGIQILFGSKSHRHSKGLFGPFNITEGGKNILKDEKYNDWIYSYDIHVNT